MYVAQVHVLRHIDRFRCTHIHTYTHTFRSNLEGLGGSDMSPEKGSEHGTMQGKAPEYSQVGPQPKKSWPVYVELCVHMCMCICVSYGSV